MKLQPIGPHLTVAILYYVGAKDDEQDTVESVQAIASALTHRGHSVKKVVVTKRNWQKAVLTPADVVFNLVEDDCWRLYMKVGRKLVRREHLAAGCRARCSDQIVQAVQTPGRARQRADSSLGRVGASKAFCHLLCAI